MKQKLTVLIPCRDERMNIRPCVEAARKVADEVLVADSGSIDDTMEIVRSMGGCRLLEREWNGYAAFKNWAIPQAEHEWVLIIDADERVTDDLAAEINQLMQNPPEHIDGYWIKRRNFVMGHEVKRCGFNNDSVFRLIRRDKCRYNDRLVHEEIFVDPKHAGTLKHKFDHYMCWSYDQYLKKVDSYTKLGAQEKWRRGKKTSSMNLLVRPFFRFLQLYVLRGGFLDGRLGIQLCMIRAFGDSFLKQARLWELECAQSQPDPEVDHIKRAA